MKYTLEDTGGRYRTGRVNGDQQIVLGRSSREFLLYSFEANGELLRIETFPTTRSAPSSAEWEIERNQILVRLGFISQPIIVNEFYDYEHDVGITPFPGDLEEFLENPDAVPKSEHPEFHESIDAWNSTGRFVFVWAGEELWVSAEGKIVAT